MTGMPSVTSAPAPTLTDGRVTLRPPTPDDVPAVVEQSRDPETVRWTTVPPDYTEADARAYLRHLDEERAAGRRTTWVVDHDGRFAGLVALRTEGAGVTEVSFATHPDHRGRGLMPAAVRLVCTHAFDQGAEVVLWHALVGNFASRKVAWKTGFRIAADPAWRAGPAGRGGRPERVWTARLLPGEPMQPTSRWLTPPTLDGDGIRIRPFREDDAAAMPEGHDPEMATFSAG